MKGRVRYTVEIATRSRGDEWRIALSRTGEFTRQPKPTARSIIERWIFEQAGQLRGGRVVIRGARAGTPRAFEATVRVRILAGDGSGRQLAVAVVGTDVSIIEWTRRRLGALARVGMACPRPVNLDGRPERQGSEVEPSVSEVEHRDEYALPPLHLVGTGRG